MRAILWTDGLQRSLQERIHSDRAHGHKQESDYAADVTEAPPGRVAGRDSPFGGEQPQSIREVPGGAENSDGVKRDGPGVLKFQLHLAKGRVGMSQNVNPTEAQMPGVPHDVEEGDAAGPALQSEHPVAGPGIICDVTLAPEPDIEAVEGVIEDGQPD